MSDEPTTDLIGETPTGETVIVKDPETGLPTITPVIERTYPIRDIKLLSDAKAAFEAYDKLEQEMTQQALVLYGIIASAVDTVNKVGAANEEKVRLAKRIIASTAGRVKEEDVSGFNFTKALIILKPSGDN